MSRPAAPALSLHLRLVIPLLCLAAGFALGFIQPLGLALGVLFCAWLLLAERKVAPPLWWPVAVIGSAAMAAHLVPGFSADTLTQPQQLSADAVPYSLRLSWDKFVLASALLAWWLGQPVQAKPLLGAKLYALCAVTLAGVPALALLTGVLGWQPKWPNDFWLWLTLNLCVTVLAEELLFRGLIQRQLVNWLGAAGGIVLASVLFAAAHLPISPLFAVFAGLAGLGYGLAFHLSGRISVAILLHLAVNTAHLLLLTYPLRLSV